MVALIVGTLFALGALTYVLWPLIAAAERVSPPPAEPRSTEHDAAGAPPGGLDADDTASDDAVEAEIRRIRAQTRVCPMCGPRPEPAARYCSRCGRALA